VITPADIRAAATQFPDVVEKTDFDLAQVTGERLRE